MWPEKEFAGSIPKPANKRSNGSFASAFNC
jgi:hypothetical protein